MLICTTLKNLNSLTLPPWAQLHVSSPAAFGLVFFEYWNYWNRFLENWYTILIPESTTKNSQYTYLSTSCGKQWVKVGVWGLLCSVNVFCFMVGWKRRMLHFCTVNNQNGMEDDSIITYKFYRQGTHLDKFCVYLKKVNILFVHLILLMDSTFFYDFFLITVEGTLC